MTMHLLKGINSTPSRKTKTKLTKKKLEQFAKDHKEHNNRLKKNHRHSEMLTFDQYVEYRLGKKTHKPKFKEWTPPVYEHRGSGIESSSSSTRCTAVAAKKEPMRYTGTVVKGVALMHKSNFVPVIDDQHAIDIAKMRRG